MKHLLVLLVVSVMLSGCGFEDDYEEILGMWDSFAFYDGYEEYEQNEYERDTYTFYRDGTGIYLHGTTRTSFSWEMVGNRHVFLRHSDLMDEDFYYRFDGRYMLVSGDRYFNTYTVYYKVDY